MHFNHNSVVNIPLRQCKVKYPISDEIWDNLNPPEVIQRLCIFENLDAPCYTSKFITLIDILKDICDHIKSNEESYSNLQNRLTHWVVTSGSNLLILPDDGWFASIMNGHGLVSWYKIINYLYYHTAICILNTYHFIKMNSLKFGHVDVDNRGIDPFSYTFLRKSKISSECLTRFASNIHKIGKSKRNILPEYIFMPLIQSIAVNLILAYMNHSTSVESESECGEALYNIEICLTLLVQQQNILQKKFVVFNSIQNLYSDIMQSNLLLNYSITDFFDTVYTICCMSNIFELRNDDDLNTSYIEEIDNEEIIYDRDMSKSKERLHELMQNFAL